VPAIFHYHGDGDFGVMYWCPADKKGVVVINSVAIFIAHRYLCRACFPGNGNAGNADGMAGADGDTGLHTLMDGMHGRCRNMQINRLRMRNGFCLAGALVDERFGDLGLNQIAAVGEGGDRTG
jgi:hypothetical protein